jgi:multidrug transporter EmrE-like cation transporter
VRINAFTVIGNKRKMRTKIILSLITGGVLLTVGDLFMKAWAVSTNKYNYFIGIFFWILGSVSTNKYNYFIGIFFWILGSLFLAWTYKYENLAIATLFYIIVNILTLALVSSFYYHEPLSIKQTIGLLLGLVSIFLI